MIYSPCLGAGGVGTLLSYLLGYSGISKPDRGKVLIVFKILLVE